MKNLNHILCLLVLTLQACIPHTLQDAQEHCGEELNTVCDVHEEKRDQFGGLYERGYRYEIDDNGNVTFNVYEKYTPPENLPNMPMPGEDHGPLIPVGGDEGQEPVPNIPDAQVPQGESTVEVPDKNPSDGWGEVDKYLGNLDKAAQNIEDRLNDQEKQTKLYTFDARGIANVLLEVTGLNILRRNKIRKERRKLQRAKKLLEEGRKLVKDNKEISQKIRAEVDEILESSTNEDFSQIANESGQKYNDNVDELYDYGERLLDKLDKEQPIPTGTLPSGNAPPLTPGQEFVSVERSFSDYARKQAGGDPIKNRVLDVADDFLGKAEKEYDAGNKEEAETLKTLATTLVDIGLSITPGVSWGRDVYEALTGKDLVTGEELSTFDRTMAVLGAVTGGVGSKAGKVMNGVDKIRKVIDKTKGAEKARDALDKADKVLESASKLSDGAKDGVEWATKVGKSADDVTGIIDSTASVGAKSAAKVRQARELVEGYLGPGTVVKTNNAGDKIFLSADGARKVRFDVKNPHGDKPHMHFEKKLPSGRWVDEIDGKHRIRFDGQ